MHYTQKTGERGRRRWSWPPSFRLHLGVALVLGMVSSSASAQNSAAWPQWGQNPQHTGFLAVAGQPLQGKLSDQVFDPFTSQEMAESGGGLLMHYQVPLVNGNNIYMLFKAGTYVPCVPPGSGQPFPCGPNDWNTEVWNETDLQWQNGQLVRVWNFATDWTPVPNDYTLGGWEPLFQPVLTGTYIYVPGAGGTIYQLDQTSGAVLQQINPFGTTEDPTKFVAGGLTADNQGNVYYNVMQVVLAWPWDSDVVDSWLVKVEANGSTSLVTYTSLLPDAPAACLGTFFCKPVTMAAKCKRYSSEDSLRITAARAERRPGDFSRRSDGVHGKPRAFQRTTRVSAGTECGRLELAVVHFVCGITG